MERITRVRAGIFLAIFIAIIAFFTLKLYDMQIVIPGGVVDNTKTFTTVTRVKAARGDILDCNGNVLWQADSGSEGATWLYRVELKDDGIACAYGSMASENTGTIVYDFDGKVKDVIYD